MKTIRNIILTAMCLCALTGVTMHIQAAEPEPLKVGIGQTYPTLNAAIAFAQSGQVIQIIGDVTETNPTNPVLIDKKVIIQGVNTPKYTVTSWAKADSPFQITAAGVTIQDLNIVINGGATTCSPIEITGDNLSLKSTSITLTGTATTVFSPILVNAGGLTMEDVMIPSTVRAPVVMDLLGNSAVFKKVFITVGANTTGIYSAISPASLVLDACSFTAAASTATPVSIPSPDGLTLADCTFSLTFSGSVGTGYGLNFTEASASDATKVLKANGCVFNLNALATAIHLNGYSGVFSDCEFNYSKGGTAIFSQSPSNADFTFTNCAFYMGKNSGDKAAYAIGLNLQNNAQGNMVIDGCTLIASCNPEAATISTSSQIISVANGTLQSLTIRNSSIALNAGAATATGVSASAESVTIANSSFTANAKTAKCVVVDGAALGDVSGNTFDIAQSAAEGIRLTNANTVSLKNNVYHLSTAGTGVVVTSTGAGSSVIVSEKNAINLHGQASQGLLIDNVSKLNVKNDITITSTESKSSIGIKANQVKSVEIDGLEMDFSGITQGVVIDGTKFPQGEEGSVRITNTNATLSGGASKAITITYANGVLIDRYHGISDDISTGALLLSFHSSTGINISNSTFEPYKSATGINSAATTPIAEPLDENGLIKKHISGDYEIYNNKFNVGEKSKAIFFGGKDTHNVAIHHNLFQANHAAGIVTVGYGRSQLVYHNIFESINSMMAVVSDGVDEIKTFSMEVDSDIYADGGIVDAYRNQFYNNQLKGSYERGFYVTNNGDVIRDNDFSEATFQYESTPGEIRNAQVLVAYSKDVKILNNRFVKARSADNPVIRVNNAILSEVTGNATQPVDGAPEVLFAQGADAVATNDMKYPETIAVHNVTNTVNGIAPIEIVREWSDPDNLIYEYILRLSEHPYTVAYYKDFVSDENLLAVEQGYSEFVEGHVLKSAEVAADLGADWLTFYRPDGYTGDIVSNINSLIINSNAAENVIIVVYLPVPATIAEPETSYIRPIIQGRISTSGPNEIYIEIDENEIPLGPPAPANPNPETGKSGTLFLYIGGALSLTLAVFPFWISKKRKRANDNRL